MWLARVTVRLRRSKPNLKHKGISQGPGHSSTEPGFINSFKIHPVPFLLIRSSYCHGSGASTLSPVPSPLGIRWPLWLKVREMWMSQARGQLLLQRNKFKLHSTENKPMGWVQGREKSRAQWGKLLKAGGVRQTCDSSGPAGCTCSKELKENQRISMGKVMAQKGKSGRKA